MSEDLLTVPARQAQAALETRTLGQSSYNFNYRSFPSDLGSSYSKDYMIININVPVAGKVPGGVRDSEFVGPNFRTTLTGADSTVDNLRNSGIVGAPGAISAPRGATLGGAVGQVITVSAGPGFLPRSTKRIEESIALFMPPGGLVYNYQNKYEEISMTAIGGKILSGGAAVAAGAARAITGGSLNRATEIARSVYGITDTAGRIVSQAAILGGFPINPRVEVLFSHNDLRQFRFDFLMSPRNEKESQTIEEIVKTLRFHSVPELSAATGGFTYIPPAEFDISFYHNGKENTKIPRINTCVLTVIEVQYDPTDGIFSTFRDGSPVAVRMTLGFQEVEPLHKARILQGL
jgi:hypothetical protein